MTASWPSGSPAELRDRLAAGDAPRLSPQCHDVQTSSSSSRCPTPALVPWAQGEPALYRAELEITADERRSASLRETFGIRDVGLQTRLKDGPSPSTAADVHARRELLFRIFSRCGRRRAIESDLELAQQAT